MIVKVKVITFNNSKYVYIHYASGKITTRRIYKIEELPKTIKRFICVSRNSITYTDKLYDNFIYGDSKPKKAHITIFI